MAKTEKKQGFDSKKVGKESAKKSLKIRRNDRVRVEILEDTTFYKKGQIVEPHRVYAESMIADKIAKEVKS